MLPTPVRPRLWRELAGWLEGRLQQGAAFELRFPAALLDLAHGQCNLPLQPLLLGELDRQMAQLRPSSRYRDRVMTLIRQQLWQESAEASSLLDGVCEHLKLTRWTLNRHLREEGCHFSGLLERVRREEACRLLQDPALPLPARAALPASFARRLPSPPASFAQGAAASEAPPRWAASNPASQWMKSWTLGASWRRWA